MPREEPSTVLGPGLWLLLVSLQPDTVNSHHFILNNPQADIYFPLPFEATGVVCVNETQQVKSFLLRAGFWYQNALDVFPKYAPPQTPTGKRIFFSQLFCIEMGLGSVQRGQVCNLSSVTVPLEQLNSQACAGCVYSKLRGYSWFS